MKKVLFLAVAAVSLSLASCDSKKEEAMDNKAEAVEANADAKADMMEAKADSTRKAGDQMSDAIEAKGDTMKKM